MTQMQPPRIYNHVFSNSEEDLDWSSEASNLPNDASFIRGTVMCEACNK